MLLKLLALSLSLTSALAVSGSPTTYEVVQLADLDLNRKATKMSSSALSDFAGSELGFKWNSDDSDTLKWRPQGISGCTAKKRKVGDFTTANTEVVFTTCSHADSGSTSSAFKVGFPTIANNTPIDIPIAFTDPSTSYTVHYDLPTKLPGAISIKAEDTNALCLSSIEVNGNPVFMKEKLFFDSVCTSTDYSGITCTTEMTLHVGKREFMAVSWYGRSSEGYADRGSRISFVDTSNWNHLNYRHVLLVDENYQTFHDMHAGGF